MSTVADSSPMSALVGDRTGVWEGPCPCATLTEAEGVSEEPEMEKASVALDGRRAGSGGGTEWCTVAGEWLREDEDEVSTGADRSAEDSCGGWSIVAGGVVAGSIGECESSRASSLL